MLCMRNAVSRDYNVWNAEYTIISHHSMTSRREGGRGGGRGGGREGGRGGGRGGRGGQLFMLLERQ